MRLILLPALACAGIVVSSLLPSTLPAQSPITAAEIAAHLRTLSSDEFEGRAPGTRGETLTTAYLIAQLRADGIRPAFDTSYVQPVAVSRHHPVPDAPVVTKLSGRITRTLEFGRDIRLYNASSRGTVKTGGELVYVGYGIVAPLYRWDDLAGLDLRGKVVVVEYGEPKLEGDTTAFNGPRASRFAESDAKVREFERRGAIGVLWLVRAGSLSKSPVRGLPQLEAGAARSLHFGGNISDGTVATLLPPGMPRMDELRVAASRRGFRATPLGIRLDVEFQTKPYSLVTHNVAGIIPGTDPALAREYVVLSAHWDHFGIGPAVNGDSIYNGALDDGSGVSALLAVARALAATPAPRSMVILFTTAEEWGMLGADHFVASGALPMTDVVANLNMDHGLELLGRARDVATLGVELSSLGETVADVAASMGLRMSPDPMPEEGLFLRSDQLAFANGGVPSLYMALGNDMEGRPAGWADQQAREYLQTHYHQPSDEYDVIVTGELVGSVQYAEFVRDVALAVAHARARPHWLPGSEFSRP